MFAFFPRFVHLLAGILALGPAVAGSLLSARRALEMPLTLVGAGGTVLRGPGQVSESGKGQAARAFPTRARKRNSVLKGAFSSPA